MSILTARRRAPNIRAAPLGAFFLQQQSKEHDMSEQWLPTLITETPQAGFELAVTLSRRGVKTTPARR